MYDATRPIDLSIFRLNRVLEIYRGGGRYGAPMLISELKTVNDELAKARKEVERLEIELSKYRPLF